MNEFRARSRRSPVRGNRLVQEMFKVVDLAAAADPDPIGRREVEQRRSYRQSLARWPIKWRERWGRRANALEDLGMSWREAEIRAFSEVSAERQQKAHAGRRRPVAVGAPA